MRSSPECPMRRSASWIFESGTMFRYGDCSSCTASACFSVPSNTGSPVVLTKSASRIESFSVSFWPERDRQYNPPAIAAAKRSPATTKDHVGTAALGCPSERGSPGSCGAGARGADSEEEDEVKDGTASIEARDPWEEPR